MKAGVGAFVGLALVLAACDPGAPPSVAGARALEGRLVAPCCFNGTLDVHESALARELREEIAVRLAHGERAESIEDDFVARFGPNVIAARTEAPLAALGTAGALAFVLAGAVLLFSMLRWTRRGRADEAVTPIAVARHAASEMLLDERLDAELADLE